jgi:TetR/AcrR family transcriptional regulator, cholesterol catabolism regulator
VGVVALKKISAASLTADVPVRAAIVGASAIESEPARLREVLDVAARLFHEKGYRSTSLADIANALGINKASVYHYVRSKEDLVRQLILRASQRLRDVSRSPEIDLLAPEQALERLVREHCEVLLDCPNEIGLLIQQRKFAEPRVLLEISERERTYVSHVRGIIARGVTQGVFRPVDVSVATALVLDTINGLLRWYRPDGTLTREQAIDAAWTFVRGGLAPPVARRRQRGR